MNHVMFFLKITMSKFLLVSNQAFIFASKDKKTIGKSNLTNFISRYRLEIDNIIADSIC